MPDAALGTEVPVPTLEEPVMLAVPAGSQAGDLLRTRGKGLPLPGSSKRDDLLVTVEVQVPKHLSPAQRALYQKLRKMEGGPGDGEQPDRAHAR